MGPNVSDTYVMLWPRERWKKATTQEELAEAIEKRPRAPARANYEFSQPIELRFNELISGVRSDVAVKVFGDDLEQMLREANEDCALSSAVRGAADVKVEQSTGSRCSRSTSIARDRALRAQRGRRAGIVEAAMGGVDAGQVLEGDRRFDLVLRLPEAIRGDLRALENLPIPCPSPTRTRTIEGGRGSGRGSASSRSGLSPRSPSRRAQSGEPRERQAPGRRAGQRARP
jgi:cobalt-zinc-cadmium resistance protein CzcA